MLPDLSGLAEPTGDSAIDSAVMLMTKPKAEEMGRALEAEWQQFENAEQRLEDREVAKFSDAVDDYSAGKISRPELLASRAKVAEQIELLRSVLDEKGRTYEELHRQLYDRQML